MLAIRLQRTGRSGHAQFRVIVQDSRFSPKRGRVTAYLGSYDPHTKTTMLDKEKAADYLSHGAQPSDKVAQLLKSEGVKLPDWVKLSTQKNKRAIRNPEKLRRNRPAGTEAPAPEAAEEASAEQPSVDATEAVVSTDVPVEEAKAIEEAATEVQKTEEPAETSSAKEPKEQA